MTKSLIISIVWLCGIHVAVGQQCGSASNTDLDGPYVSSTSSDKCSGGGRVLQLAQKQVVDHEQYGLHVPGARARLAGVHPFIFGQQFSGKLFHPLILINQAKQAHDARAYLQISAFTYASKLENGSPFLGEIAAGKNCETGRTMMLRAALERDWQ